MSYSSRVSIPNSAKKTIQNIKEIAGNHSDDEVYAMLKECSMDPNETAQKLLFQDTFHEVKRKRDKKRESNREVNDIKWRSGSQGRGPRASRGSYTSNHASHDTGAVRTVGVVMENGIVLGRDKEISSSLQTQKDTAFKANPENISLAFMSRSSGNLSSGPSKEGHISADEPSLNGSIAVEESASTIKNSGIFSTQATMLSSFENRSSLVAVTSAGVCASASDPIQVPSSNDSELLSSCEAGADEKSSPFLNAKAQGTLLEVEVAKLHYSFQSAASTTNGGISGSRPLGNFSSRAQHANGPLKSGTSKEWRRKSTNVIQAPSSEVRSTSEIDLNKGEAREAASSHASNSGAFEFSTKSLKLEDMQISDTQHVIIPDHLQVPESEISGLSFGSFDSNFGFTMALKVEPEIANCSEGPSKSSVVVEENFDEITSSSGGESPVVEDNSLADDQQPCVPQNNLSTVADIPDNLSTAPDYDKLKPSIPFSTEFPHPASIHSAPVHSNIGLVPQILGSPFATFEGADTQARETQCLPSFVVPQPFDLSSNYYASIYRPNADGGRFSPFLAPGSAPKYNGNITILPSQTGQSPQEGSNSLAFSTGPTPLPSQATGILQTSVSANQQPLPIFRHPSGVISHYPSNYIPYSQYFSPFYVPPPAPIHHFLGNGAIFPQQPHTGVLFPPTASGTGAAKFHLSQYKPSSNSGSMTQGAYTINPAGYNSTISVMSSPGNDDLCSSHFKESNVFITGQQSEGSPFWISPQGRSIPAVQASSFYNLPHAPPIAFAPSHAGPGHPLLQQSQAMGVVSEIIGPPAGVYQTPQRSSQVNWVNNF